MADKNKTLESTEPKALVIHDVVVAKRTLSCETCNRKFKPIDNLNFHCQKCQPCKPLTA